MSDMNDMTTTEAGGEGISRRDMIKGSVVAGGLVWAAPVLLTGKAAAQTTVQCCENGTPIAFSVPEGQSSSCQASVQCLDNLGLNFACDDPLLECLLSDSGFVTSSFNGAARTATIVLDPGVTLIAAAVKAGSSCYLTQCTCLATGPTEGCPNVCFHQTTNAACTFGGKTTPLPPAVGGRNRIWVLANTPTPGSTTIMVDTSPDGQLNQVELALCLSPAVTGMCA